MISGQNTSNRFEITKEIAEFCPSDFTVQSASMRMPEMVAPRVSFSDRWSRGTKTLGTRWVVPLYEWEKITSRTHGRVSQDFTQKQKKLVGRAGLPSLKGEVKSQRM